MGEGFRPLPLSVAAGPRRRTDGRAGFTSRAPSGRAKRTVDTKVYVVQTRAQGKSTRVAVGRHGVISADQARRKAAMLIARIKAGEDPSPAPSASATRPTVADLAERYLAEHVAVRCKPRTAEACRWLVAKFVLPELGALASAANLTPTPADPRRVWRRKSRDPRPADGERCFPRRFVAHDLCIHRMLQWGAYPQ